MRQYRIRSVGLASLARFGLVLGAVASAAPACLCALGASSAITGARKLLEAASQMRVPFLGQSLPVNLVEIARLQPLLNDLKSLEALGMTLVVILALGLLACLAAATTLTALLVGVAYNLLAWLTGGLEYQASSTGDVDDGNRRPAQPTDSALKAR